jgi:hypothetical protein
MDAASAIHGNACIRLSLVVISRRWRYGFVDQECVRIPVCLQIKGKSRQCFFLSRSKGFPTVFRIRIHRIHIFLDLPDPEPDPLVRGMDPDPALDSDPDPFISKQK